MKFYLTKTLIPTPVSLPQPWLKRVHAAGLFAVEAVLGLVLALLMLPVFGVLVLYDKLRDEVWLTSDSEARSPEQPEEFFQNEYVHLMMVYPDLEVEYGVEFKEWIDAEFHHYFDYFGGTIGQLVTKPEIPGLSGQLVGGLCREWPRGVFLQLFEPTINQPSAGTSWLVYLEFATLSWHRLEETGRVYLSANYSEHGLFEGQDDDGSVVQFRVIGAEDAFLPSSVI